MDWWNAKYFIRRQLLFTVEANQTIPVGYPLFVAFDYATLIASNKIRPDYADLEVLYWDESLATPSWQVLARDVYIDGSSVIVKFNSYKMITTTDSNYYLYMSNSSLLTAPTRPTYTANDYPIDTSTGSGLGLTYTRPTEDWIDGLSQTTNSKATFSFLGVNARIVVEKGPDRGILQLKVDNAAPIEIDTYSVAKSEEVIYTTSGLALGKHYLRINSTSEKNSSSVSSAIKIVKIQYSKYTQGVDQGEEINSAITALRIVVGP